VVNHECDHLKYQVDLLNANFWTEVDEAFNVDSVLTFTEYNYPGGNTLCRLCVSDISKLKKCFPAISVQYTPKHEIRLYPNPVISTLFINVAGNTSMKKMEI